MTTSKKPAINPLDLNNTTFAVARFAQDARELRSHYGKNVIPATVRVFLKLYENMLTQEGVAPMLCAFFNALPNTTPTTTPKNYVVGESIQIAINALVLILDNEAKEDIKGDNEE